MAADLSELTALVDRLGKALGDDGQRQMIRAAAPAGRTAGLKEAAHVFGGDRKFSGAKRSAKAKRAANVTYKVNGLSVEWYPSGDPWYIFLKGRGARTIRPRRKRALRTPVGPRARVHGGRLAPRPAVYDNLVTAMRDPIVKAMHDKELELIGQAMH